MHSPSSRAALAVIALYLLGYVSGALLVDPKDDRSSLSLSVVRLVAGLMLSTIAFFLALTLGLPWFTGPVAVVVLAMGVRGRAALIPPSPAVRLTWSGVAAAAIAVIALAPLLLASTRMAPGAFPPVFFNADTPYFLEKVHAITRATSYPPGSLSVVDGRWSYHFGVHGMAALIARSSGLPPHQSLFAIVLPLLAFGILAAALVFARAVNAALPAIVTIPMLLTAAPTLWYPFWDTVGPWLRQAVMSGRLDNLGLVTGNYELWGVASISGQNMATAFLVFASLGGAVAATSRGWRLPVFLIGSAVLFKAPTGLALLAGFALMQAIPVVRQRRLAPAWPVVAAFAVFGVVYGAFWILPRMPQTYRLEFFPLFFLSGLQERHELTGFIADAAWLLLPGAVLLLSRVRDDARQSLPLLMAAVAPLLLVSLLRGIDLRSGRGVDPDWAQTILPTPLILRAFALSVVGRRWPQLGVGFRALVLLAVALVTLPPLVVAARYARVLIVDPQRGHEFADNRDIGAALAVIPLDHTLLVTNDLRYPAEGFRRDNRQLQIPALFGHQAFAVNYAYESYDFSSDRMALQELLRAPLWTSAIDEAARVHHWTHLLVRKDYPHPERIPLERVYDSAVYSVFRFPTE